MPKKWISEESMRTAEKFFLNPYPVPLDEALAHGQSLLAWIDQQDKEIWSKRYILQFYKGQKAQLLAPLKARLWDLMAKNRRLEDAARENGNLQRDECIAELENRLHCRKKVNHMAFFSPGECAACECWDLKMQVQDLMADLTQMAYDGDFMRHNLSKMASRYQHAVNGLERYREEAEVLRVRLAAVEDALSRAVFDRDEANGKFALLLDFNAQDWDEAPPPPVES
jgi:hypothetical protein